jgi:hypothetical protein
MTEVTTPATISLWRYLLAALQGRLSLDSEGACDCGTSRCMAEGEEDAGFIVSPDLEREELFGAVDAYFQHAGYEICNRDNAVFLKRNNQTEKIVVITWLPHSTHVVLSVRRLT